MTCRKYSRYSRIISAAVYIIPVILPLFFLLSGGNKVETGLLNLRRMGLLMNSLWIALCTALICALISVFAALKLQGMSVKNPEAKWFFLIMAPVPSYIYALCYMNLIRFLGGFFPSLLRNRMAGMFPCIIVESLCFLPFATAAALIGMEQADSNEVKAALIFNDADTVFFRIILPKAFPYVAAMGAVIFVLSVTDYTIPSLFQVNVYAMEIFSDYSADGKSIHSLFLSLPVMVLSSAVILVSMQPFGRATRPMKTGRQLNMSYSGLLRAAGYVALAVLVIQIALPLVSMLAYTGAFINGFVPAFTELLTSVLTGIFAAVIAISLSAGSALILSEKRDGKNRLLWVMTILPLSIPGVLTGIAFLKFFSDTFLYPLRSSVLFPAAGLAVRYLPFALMIQYGCYIRMDRERIDAAYLLQGKKGDAFLKVKLPMMLPGLIITAVVVFLLSLGDVGTVLMLMPAGREPLSVKIYNYLHYGQSEAVAIFCIMQVTACMILMMMMYPAAGLISSLTRGEQRNRMHRGKGNA